MNDLHLPEQVLDRLFVGFYRLLVEVNRRLGFLVAKLFPKQRRILDLFRFSGFQAPIEDGLDIDFIQFQRRKLSGCFLLSLVLPHLQTDPQHNPPAAPSAAPNFCCFSYHTIPACPLQGRQRGFSGFRQTNGVQAITTDLEKGPHLNVVDGAVGLAV